MAQVPQYSFEGGLPGPRTIPQANPQDFARPWAALQDVGTALQHTANMVEAVGQKQRSDEAIRWSSSASSDMANKLSEFHAANKDSETFAGDLKAYADKLYGSTFAQAPNREAQLRFQGTMRPHMDALYSHALLQTEQNKITGAWDSIQKDIGNLMQAARNNAKAANAKFAVDNFRPAYDALLGSVDERYGKLAPKIAAKLKSMITAQAVTGMSEIDADHAQKMLDESPHVDENLRYTLQNRIDAARAEHSALGAHQFTSELDLRLKQADIGAVPVLRPTSEQFKAAYGKAAPWHEANFNAQADATDAAVKGFATIKDKNWAFQSAFLAKTQEKIVADSKAGKLSAVDAAAYGKLYQWSAAAAELQQKDPISWQRQYQDPVAAAYKSAESADQTAQRLAKDNPNSQAALSATAEARMKRDAAWSMALQFQGHPPADATSEQAGLYLGKDETNTHVMSPKQAEIFAEKIRAAGPNERAGIMRAWKEEYGSNWSHFYHDVITLPESGKRIPQGLELGLAIEDPSKQAAYFQAQMNAESLAKLTDDKRLDLEKMLHADPNWMALSRSMLYAYNQRSDRLEGYQSGIINYAHALIVGGQESTTQNAIKTAVQHTIGDEFGFTAPINGQVLMVPRRRPELARGQLGPIQPPRTDAEISRIGQDAAYQLWYVDPRLVATTDSTGRSLFPNAPTDELKRANYIRKLIGQGGFFVTGKDGQDAALHFRNDAGQVQQPLDVRGRPFRIEWDQLPRLMAEVVTPIIPGIGGREVYGPPPAPGRVIPDTEPIKVTDERGFWDIVTGGGVGMFPLPGYGQSRTNWPITSEAYIDQRLPAPTGAPPAGIRPAPVPVPKPKK